MNKLFVSAPTHWVCSRFGEFISEEMQFADIDLLVVFVVKTGSQNAGSCLNFGAQFQTWIIVITVVAYELFIGIILKHCCSFDCHVRSVVYQMTAAMMTSHQQQPNVIGMLAAPPPGLGAPMPPGLGHVGSPPAQTRHPGIMSTVPPDDVARLQQELAEKKQMMIKWEEGMKQATTVSVCISFIPFLYYKNCWFSGVIIINFHLSSWP